MKITKSYLRKIINEEISGAMAEIDRETISLTRIDIPKILSAIHSFLSDSQQAPPSLGFLAPSEKEEEGEDDFLEKSFIDYYQKHPDKLEDFIEQTYIIASDVGSYNDLAMTMHKSLYPVISELGFDDAPRVVRSVLEHIRNKLK